MLHLALPWSNNSLALPPIVELVGEDANLEWDVWLHCPILDLVHLQYADLALCNRCYHSPSIVKLVNYIFHVSRLLHCHLG